MNKKLPVLHRDSLELVSNQLELLDKLIKSNSELLDPQLRSRIVKLMVSHQEYFLYMVSWKYPLPENLILEYRDYWIYYDHVNLGFHWLDRGLLHNKKVNLNGRLINSLKDYLPWKEVVRLENNKRWNIESLISCKTEIVDAAEERHSVWQTGFFWFHFKELIYKEICKSISWNVKVIDKYFESLPWDILTHIEKFNKTLYKSKKYRHLANWAYLTPDFIISVDGKTLKKEDANYELQLIKTLKEHENKWDWKKLSSYDKIKWTTKIITLFKDKWDWSKLSNSKGVEWTLGLINKFSSRWDWAFLIQNDKLPWSTELVAIFMKKKRLRHRLSMSKNLPWSIELIREFEKYWHWDSLSRNNSLPWSYKFIIEFKDKWEIREWLRKDFGEFGTSIDGNSSIKWTDKLIRIFYKQIAWGYISRNSNVFWSVNLIEKYIDNWDWEKLSRNRYLPWSEELIAKFIDKWSFAGLSTNHGIPWSEDILFKYKDKWDYKRLSWNRSFPWSKELIFGLRDRISWAGLSANGGEFIDEELISKYEDEWVWKDPKEYDSLGHNKSIQWTFNLLERYEDKWNWDEFYVHLLDCGYMYLGDKEPNFVVWEKAILPLLSEDIIDEIMKEITKKGSEFKQ